MFNLYTTILGVLLSAILTLGTISYIGTVNANTQENIQSTGFLISEDQLNAVVQAFITDNMAEKLPTCEELQAQKYITDKTDCTQINAQLANYTL